ncbi:MAG: hypothetical protein K8R58_07320 [Bacteroidales bacterium]|nr:hypothetical protein [Bacteroidales bacterium]
MRKIDKLKHNRYEIEMKIIDLNSKQSRNILSKKEQDELVILKEKKEKLDKKIKELL